MPKPTAESGAPAALKAIEEHEVQCRIAKDEAYRKWRNSVLLAVEGDDVSERNERLSLRDYNEALQMWDDATKKLAVFDKGVKQERREGEKVLVSEAKEIFKQFNLCYRMAIESYIITISQNVFECKSSQEFHGMHAENLRVTVQSAINDAKRDGVLPKWIAE